MAYDRMARKIAAKKAAKTRRENHYAMKYYREVTEPGRKTLQLIMWDLLCSRDRDQAGDVRLRWNPKGGAAGRKLKNGASEGTLVGFRAGFYLKVKPDGYKQPKTWHPAFWELIR
jgi:hypothetical protein